MSSRFADLVNRRAHVRVYSGAVGHEDQVMAEGRVVWYCDARMVGIVGASGVQVAWSTRLRIEEIPEPAPESAPGPVVADPRRRWTPETGELISRTLMLPPCSDAGCHTNVEGRARLKAGTVLGILADAGLLLPPGGVSEPVWRSYDTVTGGSIEVHSLERANELVARDGGRPRPYPQLVVQTATRTTWPDGAVHTGPWSEVAQ